MSLSRQTRDRTLAGLPARTGSPDGPRSLWKNEHGVVGHGPSCIELVSREGILPAQTRRTVSIVAARRRERACPARGAPGWPPGLVGVPRVSARAVRLGARRGQRQLATRSPWSRGGRDPRVQRAPRPPRRGAPVTLGLQPPGSGCDVGDVELLRDRSVTGWVSHPRRRPRSSSRGLGRVGGAGLRSVLAARAAWLPRQPRWFRGHATGCFTRSSAVLQRFDAHLLGGGPAVPRLLVRARAWRHVTISTFAATTPRRRGVVLARSRLGSAGLRAWRDETCDSGECTVGPEVALRRAALRGRVHEA